MKLNAFELVTNTIIEKLESGICPWHKPWRSLSGHLPSNAISGNEYRGINQMILGFNDYADHRWLTFLQAKELGGSVRQGEKSQLIAFYKPSWEKKVRDDETGQMKKVTVQMPVLTTARVFNVEQCEGLKLKALASVDSPSSQLQKIGEVEGHLANYLQSGPAIKEGCNNAYYSPMEDLVGMPAIAQFESDITYYATLLHELIHSTGHEKRLKRKGFDKPIRFGSEVYSEEELIAELGSAFLLNAVGLQNDQSLTQSAAYLKGWINALKGDSRLLLKAAGAAGKAANYIRGIE